MSCHIHNQKKEVSRCKVCGNPICGECQDVQNYYDGCPKCKKESLQDLQKNYKRGLFANILSVVCIIAFFVFYAIEVVARTASQTIVIAGAVLGGIMAAVSIALLIRTIVKISKLGKLLNSIK